MKLLASLQNFTFQLDQHRIEYAVIGGFAVFAYGGQRTTFDVDFLIHQRHRKELYKIAQVIGLQVAHENTEVLQLSGAAQFDIIFANRPRAQKMLSRTQILPNFPFPVVSAEDLIGLKIQAFCADRSREFTDKGDILEIFRNTQDLNLDLIREYADIFGVWEEIKDLKGRL